MWPVLLKEIIKCQFCHFEVLIPTESAHKEHYVENCAYDAKVKLWTLKVRK